MWSAIFLLGRVMKLLISSHSQSDYSWGHPLWGRLGISRCSSYRSRKSCRWRSSFYALLVDPITSEMVPASWWVSTNWEQFFQAISIMGIVDENLSAIFLSHTPSGLNARLSNPFGYPRGSHLGEGRQWSWSSFQHFLAEMSNQLDIVVAC